MGYNSPTPVQEQAIPLILDGQDMIACAQTGTGKTAAYLLPLIDRISHGNYEHTSTLVLVPTRELAKQIDEQVEGFGYFASVSSIAIYGGNKGDDWDLQKPNRRWMSMATMPRTRPGSSRRWRMVSG